MVKRTIFLITSTLLLAWSLMACQAEETPVQCADSLGCVELAPISVIKIIALQTLSGEMAPLGLDQIRSFKLAMANRNNRILGHPILLQAEDSPCTREGGNTTALKVVADPQTIAVLGTYCSGSAVPAAKIISGAGMVMVSASNTASSLTAVGGKPGANWQPGYFRTAYNDEVLGRAAATFAIHKLGVSTVATINDGDPYTRGLTEVFNQTFAQLGGQTVLDATINKGETDMRPILTAVAASGAELVFFPIFEPEGNLFVRQRQHFPGLNHLILMSADGLLASTFVAEVGQAATGMYFAGPSTPQGHPYETFVAQYKSTYGEPPIAAFHAHAYDAANLLFAAIEQVALQQPDGSLLLGRQALRDALYATRQYPGLTGRLTCTPFGDCGAARFNVMRLDDPAAGFEALTANVVFTYNGRH